MTEQLLISFEVYHHVKGIDTLSCRLDYYKSNDVTFSGTSFEYYWQIVNFAIGVNVDKKPLYVDFPSVFLYLESVYLVSALSPNNYLSYRPVVIGERSRYKQLVDTNDVNLVHRVLINRYDRLVYAYNTNSHYLLSALFTSSKGYYPYTVYIIDLKFYIRCTDLEQSAKCIDKFEDFNDARRLFDDIVKVHPFDKVISERAK